MIWLESEDIDDSDVHVPVGTPPEAAKRTKPKIRNERRQHLMHRTLAYQAQELNQTLIEQASNVLPKGHLHPIPFLIEGIDLEDIFDINNPIPEKTIPIEYIGKEPKKEPRGTLEADKKDNTETRDPNNIEKINEMAMSLLEKTKYIEDIHLQRINSLLEYFSDSISISYPESKGLEPIQPSPNVPITAKPPTSPIAQNIPPQNRLTPRPNTNVPQTQKNINSPPTPKVSSIYDRTRDPRLKPAYPPKPSNSSQPNPINVQASKISNSPNTTNVVSNVTNTPSPPSIPKVSSTQNVPIPSAPSIQNVPSTTNVPNMPNVQTPPAISRPPKNAPISITVAKAQAARVVQSWNQPPSPSAQSAPPAQYQLSMRKSNPARPNPTNTLKRKFEPSVQITPPGTSSSTSSTGIPQVITSKTGQSSNQPPLVKKPATLKSKNAVPTDKPESLADRGRILILNVEPTSKKPRVVCRTPGGDIVLGHPNQFDDALHNSAVNRSHDLHIRNYSKIPYFVCRDGKHWKIIGPVSRIEPIVREFILKKASQVPEL
ncbi:hypothetical protein CLU79DRAFT_835732 [Phycomyces nitens]|nr:hypothetical protein CLU79DRAFT_835732 [Phycomyces nitens]